MARTRFIISEQTERNISDIQRLSDSGHSIDEMAWLLFQVIDSKNEATMPASYFERNGDYCSEQERNLLRRIKIRRYIKSLLRD